MFYGTLGLFRKRETPYSPELSITVSSTYLATPYFSLGAGGAGTEYLISKANNQVTPTVDVTSEYLISKANNQVTPTVDVTSEYLISKANNSPSLGVGTDIEYVIKKNSATVPLTISS